jgi:hypothetical protein
MNGRTQPRFQPGFGPFFTHFPSRFKQLGWGEESSGYTGREVGNYSRTQPINKIGWKVYSRGINDGVKYADQSLCGQRFNREDSAYQPSGIIFSKFSEIYSFYSLPP